MRELRVEVGHAHHREHVDARCERDIGQSELVAAQPWPPVGELVLHLRHLFHQHDAERWGSLGAALLTLFQIVTLEGWVEVMEKALEFRPLAWIYFVSFVLIGTFVVLNLFIAVVVNNLEASKAAELEALARPVTHDDVLEELARTRDALQALQRKLASFPEVERPGSTE